MPVTVRHALANLYRPGSQARSVLTALGVGVMFTLTVFLIQRSVLVEIRRSAPPGMANVFFIDITAEQRQPLLDLVDCRAGGRRQARAAVRGVGANRRDQWHADRADQACRLRTAIPDGPHDLHLRDDAGRYRDPPRDVVERRYPQISVSEGVSRGLRVDPGAEITWNAFGKIIRTRVAAVHRTDNQRLHSMVEFYTNPGTLESLPTVYYGAARVATPRDRLLAARLL